MKIYKKGWNLDKVMEVIRKENIGKRSVVGKDSWNTECMYRTDDGNKCLVGCFIPDDKYDPDMEYTNFTGIIGYHGIEKSMPMIDNEMIDLQRFHDNTIPDYLTGEPFFEAIEQYLASREAGLDVMDIG